MVLLLNGPSGTLVSQPLDEKNLKYMISGTTLQGGVGLFTLASPDVLPRGRFAGGTTYATKAARRSSSINYALGFGIASGAEASVVFSNSLGDTKYDISQAGLKLNILRGTFRDDFLGSLEITYLQTDQDAGGSPVQFESYLAQIRAGLLFGNVEMVANVGYALQTGGSIYANRLLVGASGFAPVLRNVIVGVEVSSDHSATAGYGWGLGAGVKVGVLDHFQLTVMGRSVLHGSRFTPGMMIGLSFSSAFYRIAPDRERRIGRVPPLPTLDELEKKQEK